MSTVGRFFAGLWRGLDGLRKFLHLLLLLVFFGFIIGALRGSVPKVPEKAALLVSLQGSLVEQLSGDPIERAIEETRGQGRTETLLWDVTDSIRTAAKDRRIPAVVLDVENFEGAGQPILEELARAIAEFRATGKPVIAYGINYTQAQYYVAAQADEVYVDPLGYVLIQGYDRYRMFYKDLLDKVGVDINIFRVGAYKSAVEEYTRNDMSPEDREDSRGYLNALWTSYQGATTRARKLAPDAIANYVAALPQSVPAAHGDTAAVALNAGLVTGVKSQIDVEKRLIQLVGEDESNGSFRSVSVDDYVRYAHAQMKLKGAGAPKVGVIIASGEILDGEQPPGTIGGDSTARLVREARMDKDIRAVVLRVDSPGGSVQASEEIYREILALKASGKPVVVSMSDLAASGGYYISAPADEIIASPATITGSIGIFAVIPTINRTLAKVGVNVDGFGTTALAGQLRLDRALGPEARTLLQSIVSRGYEEFLARVATGRKKTRDQVDSIAQGRVWAGSDALRIGLVDRLGSFDDAVRAAAKRANLDTYQVRIVEPELTWTQQLVLSLKTTLAQAFVGFDSHAQALTAALARLDPLAKEVARLSRFSGPDRLYAYCFCSVE